MHVKQAFCDAINTDTHLGIELDIFIPSRNIAVEYDGEAWHRSPKREKNDIFKNDLCRNNEITLLRIREPKLPKIENCITSIREDSTSSKSLNTVIQKVLMFLGVTNLTVDTDADSSKILSQFSVNKQKNSLAYCYPEIAKEWHPTKNGTLKPDEVSKASRRTVWWLGKCGHEWNATVSKRTRPSTIDKNGRIKKPYGCPYCSGRRLGVGINDLESNNPELAKEWHPTKNGDLLPSMVTAFSNQRVWWMCKEGHEWQSSINHRNSRKSGCPICSAIKRSPKVICIDTGLQEGGGVCGYIFQAAGSKQLQDACNSIGGCKTGSAVITPGFKLCKYIVHAVGPVWHGGNSHEPQDLYSCYRKSMDLAKENNCRSIGFPLISAGIFGYPKDKAWRKALQAVSDWLKSNQDYDIDVIFAILDKDIIELGTKAAADLNISLGSSEEKKNAASPSINSKNSIHAFAIKYRNLYLNPSTKESDVFEGFADACFGMKFEMDCGKQFEEMYSHDAFYKAESLNQIIDKIDNISILTSGIFSKFRYVTYWSHSNLLDSENRSWFIQAFYQLARITE